MNFHGIFTMLSNFDFLDLRPEDSGSFISGTRRKCCSVRLAMADRGCICCDRMMMRRTRCAVFLSYEKRVSLDFTHINVPVR